MQFITSSMPEGHYLSFSTFQLGKASPLRHGDLWQFITMKRTAWENCRSLIQMCLECQSTVMKRWKSSLADSSPLRTEMETVCVHRRELLVPVSMSLIWHCCQCRQWNLLARFPPSLISLYLLANMVEKYFILTMKMGPSVFIFLTSLARQEPTKRSASPKTLVCETAQLGNKWSEVPRTHLKWRSSQACAQGNIHAWGRDPQASQQLEGAGPVAGPIPRQQDTKTKQAHLDTSNCSSCSEKEQALNWEALSWPWLWISLKGTNRYFICFRFLFIKNLLKSRFWTSAKCIMKMSLSHTRFLPSSRDHWLLFPPLFVPSIVLCSRVISHRNPDFHTLCINPWSLLVSEMVQFNKAITLKDIGRKEVTKFLWSRINLQQMYVFQLHLVLTLHRDPESEGHNEKSCSFPSVSSLRSRGGKLSTMHLGGLCHMHFQVKWCSDIEQELWQGEENWGEF